MDIGDHFKYHVINFHIALQLKCFLKKPPKKQAIINFSVNLIIKQIVVHFACLMA